MAGAAKCDGSSAGAYDEPQRVAAEAVPECASFCCCERGVAFPGDCLKFARVVCGIQFSGRKLGLAGAAVLHVIIQRFEVGGRDLRGGNRGVGQVRGLPCRDSVRRILRRDPTTRALQLARWQESTRSYLDTGARRARQCPAALQAIGPKQEPSLLAAVAASTSGDRGVFLREFARNA